MAKQYDLNAETVPRKESIVFALVDSAESAVVALWENAEKVVKQTG